MYPKLCINDFDFNGRKIFPVRAGQLAARKTYFQGLAASLPGFGGINTRPTVHDLLAGFVTKRQYAPAGSISYVNLGNGIVEIVINFPSLDISCQLRNDKTAVVFHGLLRREPVLVFADEQKYINRHQRHNRKDSEGDDDLDEGKSLLSLLSLLLWIVFHNQSAMPGFQL